jgi:hypothetical protein
VDTVTEQSQAYRALQPPGLTNQFAALPSLRLGWNVVVGIVLLTTTAHVAVRLFAVSSPLAMGFAVIATANHFVVDVAAGSSWCSSGSRRLKQWKEDTAWLHSSTVVICPRRAFSHAGSTVPRRALRRQ